MSRRQIGRAIIKKAEFGYHFEHQDFGLLLEFDGYEMDGNQSHWGLNTSTKYMVNMHPDCKYAPGEKEDEALGVIQKTADILKAAGATDLRDIVGRRVEVAILDHVFIGFGFLP